MLQKGPIGIFDSGYGGLTVLDKIVQTLPQYDFLYLGDNAKAPYGTRAFETVLEYTWQAIEHLFEQGCPLVILACNTASAKALRTIQKTRLRKYPGKNVLGVIRPTTESVAQFTKTKKIGVFGTEGTVASLSYPLEIEKFFPKIQVFQQACPIWVPLVESNTFELEGGRFFIRHYFDQLFDQESKIDTVLLGCTHYPILLPLLKEISRPEIHWINQGDIVAPKLRQYLEQHPEYEKACSKNGAITFQTTGNEEKFSELGSLFYKNPIHAQKISL